jgi:uncharacterized protein with gpF-like domain
LDLSKRVPELRKKWQATADGRTRETHLVAHMRYKDDPIPIDEPFQVGSALLMYPTDPAGPPGETINCRCNQLTVHPEMGNVGSTVDGRIAATLKRRREALLWVAREMRATLAPQAHGLARMLEARAGVMAI